MIVTRGMGADQRLVTRGYGAFVTIRVDNKEYQFGGIGYASKEGFQYLKDLERILDDVIETEKIRLKKESLDIYITVDFAGISPVVLVELDSIKYWNHHIKVKITNYKEV